MRAMYVCGICLKEFERSRHLRLHNGRVHVDKSKWKSKCATCGKVYADDEILRRHEKNHKKVRHKSECPVEECRKLFIRKSFLEKHVALNHPELRDDAGNAIGQTSMSKKSYCCKEEGCSASFAKHHLLTQHSYVHTKIPPFQCSHCDKRFLNQVHKNRHEKVHNGYACTHCDVVLKTWSHLRTHVAKNHRKEYKCNTCDKVFYAPGRLKHHSLIHSETRQVYQCSACERNFTRKRALIVHMKVAHEGVKEFACPVTDCNKCYAYKHSLEKHIEKFHNLDGPCSRKTRSDKLSTVSRILGVNADAMFAEKKDAS